MRDGALKKRGIARKFKEGRGETLTEVLVALLIAVPALGMIAGAITTSATINSRMETETGRLQKFIPSMDGSGTKLKRTFTLSKVGEDNIGDVFNGAYIDIAVDAYNDDGEGYYYYFKDKQ